MSSSIEYLIIVASNDKLGWLLPDFLWGIKSSRACYEKGEGRWNILLLQWVKATYKLHF